MLLCDLNDDCLYQIFRLLMLEDQIVLRKITPRFDQLIHFVWRHSCKKVELNRDVLRKFKENQMDQDLLLYMRIICDVVEQLKLDGIQDSQFRMLRDLKFLNLYSLNCNIWTSEKGTSDDDVLLMAQMFPALRTLKLLSTITGQHIWLLSNVTELDLSCCEFLKSKHFPKIFTTLKLRKFSLFYYGYNTVLNERISAITQCETLEELKIDDHHLLLFIDSLLLMPRMRKVTCYTRDYDSYLLDRIADAVGNRMEAISFNDVFWSKYEHVRVLLKMTQLRELSLHDDDIEEDQIDELAGHFPFLESLNLTKMRLESSEGFIDFISSCPKLKLLDISHTPKLNIDFLEQLSCSLNNQQRSTTLKVHCFGTDIAEKFSQETILSRHLKLSVSEQRNNLPISRTFQCEWRPRADSTVTQQSTVLFKI